MLKNLKNVFKRFSEEVKVISKREVSEREIDQILENLEINLLSNNVAFDVAEKILEDIKKEIISKEIKGNLNETVRDRLKNTVKEILDNSRPDFNQFLKELNEKKPYLILFIGPNGSGKTTTIAKFASYFKDKRIVLSASDTFRDASIEQITHHAKNLNLKVIKHNYGSDPAAVVFDAVKFAENRHYDLILSDTAGRSHSNKNLMDELKKIKRVNNPDKTILVIDSLIGNNVVNILEDFSEINFDYIILTKLDADEKGGTILNVSYLSEKPILFLGIGQNYDDLIPYEPEYVMERIFSGI